MRSNMKQPKNLFFFGIGVAFLVGVFHSPLTTNAQAPDDKQAIAQLVAEIAEQQAKIVANQTAMDEKIAAVAENLRVAKIYVSRAK